MGAKGPRVNVELDAIEVSLPGVNPSNIEVQWHSFRASNVCIKRHVSEDDGGSTISKRRNLQGKQDKQRLPTPINLFDDECVFCHSFRTSQFHGPMVHYLKGRLVNSDEGNLSNIIYVHKKCMEWSPRVWYEGDTIMNLESEISRASRLKCSRCRLPGAALGCYYEHCMRSFHVPCAVQILDCRWDVDNGLVLCPEHVSKRLPCDDDMNSLRNKSENSAFLSQSQCSDKLEGVSTNHQREDQQTDHVNSRNQIVDQWVLLGSGLSTLEKDLLLEFASWTNATMSNEWTTNVTHVIVGKSNSSAWSRSYEVLMAILFGKWIVTTEWIDDSLDELHPVSELSYEIKFNHDLNRLLDGPEKGRIRAAEGASKLFEGLCFCLSAFMKPDEREHLQELIAAADGEILQGSNLHWFCPSLNKSSVNPYFVYDGGAPEEFTSSYLSNLRKEIEEGIEYAAWGAQVVSHLRVFDAIAAYDAEILN